MLFANLFLKKEWVSCDRGSCNRNGECDRIVQYGWILDQYKEKKPKDPTIAAKFNAYRFADYKNQVIDCLQTIEINPVMEPIRWIQRP